MLQHERPVLYIVLVLAHVYEIAHMHSLHWILHVPVFALVGYFCAMGASSLASRAAAASGSLVGQHTPTLSRRLETSSRPRTPVLLATTGGHQRLVLWLAIADALELCSQLGLALRLPVRLFGGTLSLLVLLLLTP